jgi:DNA-binding CsgD family transcriptional regulator
MDNEVGASVASQLDVPLVVVDATLEIVWCNRAALARRGDAWSALFESGGSRAAHFMVRMQLQDLVLACLRRRAETETVVESREGGWFASASPVEQRPGLALLRVSSMHQAASGAGERLHRLFGLTEAEAQITVQLATGASLESIAEARGVSVDTVRAQVRSVFKKTGIHRQGELICAVGRMAAG